MGDGEGRAGKGVVRDGLAQNGESAGELGLLALESGNGQRGLLRGRIHFVLEDGGANLEKQVPRRPSRLVMTRNKALIP
jgi:hypothetical protein